MSRRSQHRRRTLSKDFDKWTAYMPEAVEEARRIAARIAGPIPQDGGGA